MKKMAHQKRNVAARLDIKTMYRRSSPLSTKEYNTSSTIPAGAMIVVAIDRGSVSGRGTRYNTSTARTVARNALPKSRSMANQTTRVANVPVRGVGRACGGASVPGFAQRPDSIWAAASRKAPESTMAYLYSIDRSAPDDLLRHEVQVVVEQGP